MSMSESRTSGSDHDTHVAAMLAVEEGIARLVITMRSRWKSLAQEVHPDLQPIGFRVMAALYAGGPQRAKDLVERLGSNKSVLSRQLAQLERLGLVERRVDPDDGRVIHMAVTQAAVQRLSDIEYHDSLPHFQRLLSWPTERLQEFAAMLEDFSGSDGEEAALPSVYGASDAGREIDRILMAPHYVDG